MKSNTVNYDHTSKKYQYAAAVTGSLTLMGTGMHYGWPSPAIPKLLEKDSPVPITNEQSSWVVVSLLFGTFLGANIAGVFVNRIGRKKVLLITAFPLILSWIVLAFGKSMIWLMIGRFIGGLSDGAGFAALPMYMSEISDPKIRGFLGTWSALSQTIGILLMNTIASYIDLKTSALIALAAPVAFLLTFWWMPESPYYLILKGHFNKARESLRYLRGTDDVDQELDRLTKTAEQQNNNKRRYLDLFTDKINRKALYISICLRSAFQFAGTVAIMFYAQTIFKDAGDGISPTVGSIIYFSIQIVVLIFSSVIVDKTGRKPLMMFSTTGAGLCLLIEGCYFYLQDVSKIDTKSYSWVPIAALIMYIITFGIGMSPLVTIVISELFSTNVRAFAMSFASNYFCISAIFVSKFFHFTKDHYGTYVPFIVFAICCFLSLFYIKIFVPETKGKTLEEIQEELSGHKRKDTDMRELDKMVDKPQ